MVLKCEWFTKYNWGCQVCEIVGDGDDINTRERMDQGNDVCLDRVGKFSHLRHMVSGGRGANSALVMRVRCAWESLESHYRS